MSQQGFHDSHSRWWRETWELIDNVDRGAPDPRTASFPERYRRICQHLALARHRRYGAELLDALNRAALRGHKILYRHHARPFERVGQLVAVEFPRAVRREWRLLLLSTLLFVGPLVAMAVAVNLRPELVYTVVDPLTVSRVESMYDPSSDHFLQERPSESDLQMFGFYIRNNVGIGFRTFASGLLLGLGSAFVLFTNGLFIGALAGHINEVGYGPTFYAFIIGHGAFELTAIVLAGLAGMKLGGAVLSPGRKRRGRALVEAARESLVVVYGFAGMLFLAAFLEAFWSSTTVVPASVKLIVGAVLWLAVIAYFAIAGRGGRVDLDRLEAVLRPRTSFEAVDLGLAMGRRWAGPIYKAWLVGTLPLYALVWALLIDHPIVALAVVWWLKPLWDQAPLFVVSRALFGEVHGIRPVLRALPKLYLRQLFWGLVYYRLDWARSFFQPVLQLEQAGFRARGRRRAALLRSTEMTTAWLTFVFLCLEVVVAAGLLGLVVAFLPSSPELAPRVLVEAWWDGIAPLWVRLIVPVVAFAALTTVEPLYVTAGFSLYINRRTVLEGWDVELVFRRLADRLGARRSSTGGGAAAALVLALLLSAGGRAVAEEGVAAEAPVGDSELPSPGSGSEASAAASEAPGGALSPDEAVRRVLARREFDTTEHRRVWRLRRDWSFGDGNLDDFETPEWLQGVGRFVAAIIEPVLWAVFGVLLLVLMLFVLSRLRGRDEVESQRPSVARARVGLSLPPPAALPPDVSAAARSLWEQGLRAQALGLLYRGAVVRLVEIRGLSIEDGATEGECLRAVQRGTKESTAAFFSRLTAAWQRSAYAHRHPADEEALSLCGEWPRHFEEGG